jgi:hypothetical protein
VFATKGADGLKAILFIIHFNYLQMMRQLWQNRSVAPAPGAEAAQPCVRGCWDVRVQIADQSKTNDVKIVCSSDGMFVVVQQ